MKIIQILMLMDRLVKSKWVVFHKKFFCWCMLAQFALIYQALLFCMGVRMKYTSEAATGGVL